jgi:predicted nucleotidyltransferase
MPVSTPHTPFPDLLRQHREAAGLTLQEVADKLRTDFSLVSKWERGARKPDRKQVQALARVLKADPRILLTAWLRDAVVYAVGEDELALEAVRAAEAQVAYKLFNKQDRNAIVRKLKAGLARFPKVRKAWLFGSFARKDDKPGSDIDLAIEVQDPFSYFELADVQYQLEQLVGRKVDVGFMDAFRPHVRARIEPDLRLIHEG